MNAIYNDLIEQKQQLQKLEQKLDHLYERLGKKTQEFVEHESGEINQTVDEVIKVKQSIAALEKKLATMCDERNKIC